MVHRCKCGNCALALEVKPGASCGCLEIEPCKEKMLEENMHDQHLILVVLITLWKYQDFSIPPLQWKCNDTPYPLEFPISSVAGWVWGYGYFQELCNLTESCISNFWH